MASASECYDALCDIRRVIVAELAKLEPDSDIQSYYNMCITDLLDMYTSYTGKTGYTYDVDFYMSSVPASIEHLHCVVRDDSRYIVCLEVESGVYDWIELGPISTLLEYDITSDGTYNASDFGADGFSKVTVNTSVQRNLQNKTTTPSSEIQVISADNGFSGLSTVTVKAVPVENINIIPTEAEQIIEPSEGHFFKQVKVDAVINQNKDAVPDTFDQVITADEGFNGLAEVRIAGDPNLLPEHILKDVTIFNVTGVLEQNATIGRPLELSTVDEIEQRRELASAETLGAIYKYTGETTDVYVKDTLYIVGLVDSTYTMQKLSASLLRLPAPSIRIDGDVISWDAVPYASSYAVCTDSYTLGYTNDTRFTVSFDYDSSVIIHVIAIAPGYDSSFNSNSVIWYSSTVQLTKYNNIPFPVPTAYSQATDFNNNAVFYCQDLSGNNKLLSFDTTLIHSELLIDNSGTEYECLTSSNEYLFLTDSVNIYAYDADMSFAVRPLVYARGYKQTARVNNYALFADTSAVEAIDASLVSIDLGIPSFSDDYQIYPCSPLYHALFIQPLSYQGVAYDADLVRVNLYEVPKAYGNVSSTYTNDHAIYAGGHQYISDGEGTSTHIYYSNAFAYDKDLTYLELSNLSEKKDSTVAASFNGFAVFAGGSGFDATGTMIEYFDAKLTCSSLVTPLCSTKYSTVDGAGTGAAAVANKYLIIGALDDFMFADVLTTEQVE